MKQNEEYCLRATERLTLKHDAGHITHVISRDGHLKEADWLQMMR